MHYKAITSSDELWYKIRNYAESCSWRAGKALANAMDNNVFQEWERVIVAIDNDYDLSINKYKKVEYVAVKYPSTEEIFVELRSLEKEVAKEMDELEKLLQ